MGRAVLKCDPDAGLPHHSIARTPPDACSLVAVLQTRKVFVPLKDIPKDHCLTFAEYCYGQCLSVKLPTSRDSGILC